MNTDWIANRIAELKARELTLSVQLEKPRSARYYKRRFGESKSETAIQIVLLQAHRQDLERASEMINGLVAAMRQIRVECDEALTKRQ